MVRCKRKKRSISARRFGTAVTELAVTLPVLLIMLLGTIECCAMIFVTQTLHVAAYEGARVALVPKITKAQVEHSIKQILNDRRVKDATITISPSNFSTAPMMSFIKISVTAPANTNMPVTPLIFTGQVLKGECSMMKEY